VGSDRSARTPFIIYHQKYVSDPNSLSNIPTSVLRPSSQKYCSRKSCRKQAGKERGRAPPARLHRLRPLNCPAKRKESRNSGPSLQPLRDICHHHCQSFVYYVLPENPLAFAKTSKQHPRLLRPNVLFTCSRYIGTRRAASCISSPARHPAGPPLSNALVSPVAPMLHSFPLGSLVREILMTFCSITHDQNP
jgi:hypothetical protein